MWKLTIMDDEGKQTELPLSRGEYAIGRAEENTVRLTDRNISRKHLVLKRGADEGWVVEDLNSYNGCFVNGMRVSGTHPLYHGDLLQLGDYRLELQDESAVAGSDDATQEMPTASAATLLDRPDRLVVVDGAAAGTEFPLEGERIIIGRAEDADISINHSSVSRTHAEIVNLGAGVYELFDRGSSNGLRVNGIKFERRVIEDDDEIELGDVRLRFVARGRIFRPGGAPRTLGYTSATASASHSAQRKGGLGVMIAVGAALGIVAVLGFVALRNSAVEPASGTTEERTVLDQAVLEAAKKLSEAQDHEGAHAKLSELPETSPLRDSALVREIEGKWADEMFSTAATTSDPEKRREILKRISSAPLVDSERRKRASDMITQMDTGGTDIGSLPVADNKAADAGERQPGPLPNGLAPNPFEGDSTSTAATTGNTAPKPPPTSTDKKTEADKAREAILDDKKETDDRYSAARGALEPRVWSGRATVDEIKMLRAICRQQRDSACVAKCTSMLKSKQD